MFDWPTCARQGCGFPAFFKVEFIEDGVKTWVHLCPACVLEAPACFRELAKFREEQKAEMLLRAEQDLLEGPIEKKVS